MAQADSTRARVSIFGVAKDFGLWQTKKLLEETLRNKNAVSEVKFLKYENDSTKPCVIIAYLRDEKYADILLAKAVIEVEIRNTLHRLKITKARCSGKSEKPEKQSNQDTIARSAGQISVSPTSYTRTSAEMLLAKAITEIDIRNTRHRLKITKSWPSMRSLRPEKHSYHETAAAPPYTGKLEVSQSSNTVTTESLRNPGSYGASLKRNTSVSLSRDRAGSLRNPGSYGASLKRNTSVSLSRDRAGSLRSPSYGASLKKKPLSHEIQDKRKNNTNKLNTIESRVVNIPYAVSLFLSNYHEDIHTKNGLKDVEWHRTEPFGGISIKGNSLEAAKAERWIKNEASLILTTSQTVSEPGMNKYLHGKIGQQFLKTTESILKCVILIDTDQYPNWKFFSQKSTMVHGSSLSMTVNIPTLNHGSSCTLSVVQNDITEHHCDAIVYESNANLEQLGTVEVSNRILNKGGKMIQLEMDSEKAKRGGGLEPGQVVTTYAGLLPCNRIIHVMGPDWSSTNAIIAIRCLRKCVVASLQEAEEHKLKSIAFPAISCDPLMGGKPDTCIRLIVKTIVEYFKQNTSTIQQVYLIEMNDMEILHEFNKAVSNIEMGSERDNYVDWTQTRNNIWEKGGNPLVTPTKIYGSALKVTFKIGDISEHNADVIVTATAPKTLFTGRGSSVSRALCEKAGPDFELACKEASITNLSATVGDVVQTPGYNLPCNKVYHMLLYKYKANRGGSLFISAIRNCLTMADTDGFTQIAFPAIGTRGMNYPVKDVAQWFKSEIMNFAAINLRQVDFVLLPTNHVLNAVFRNTFETSLILKSGHSPVGSASYKDDQTVRQLQASANWIIPYENQLSNGDQAMLYFCAKEQSCIDETWKRIREHVKDKSLTKIIESEAIGNLCSAAEDELMSLQSTHDVIIRKRRSATRHIKLVISGLKDNVKDAFTSASGIIQDYKDALTCAEYVTWKYMDNQTQQMKDFPLRSSWKIECAYKSNNKGQVTLPVKVLGTNYNFNVDFSVMQERCIETDVVVEILRSLNSCIEDFPSTWDDTGNVAWKLVELSTSSLEYVNIIQKFTATGSNLNVLKLERIQNPTLYKQFQAQKSKVEERMKNDGCNLPVAHQLFHGTSADVCSKIYKDGFDRSHAGRHAISYGRGVYFATTSQYSQRFANPDANGEMRMFLAEVITGEFCQGNRTTITPPVKPGHKNDLYDSVVNNVSNPSIFVVFKDASVYPAYILTFK